MAASSSVATKRSRVSRELDSLEDKEEKASFKLKLKQLAKAFLKKEPEKLKRVQMVMKMDARKSWDKTVHFAPDLEGRHLARLPAKFLHERFLLVVTNHSAERLKKMLKLDKQK